MQFTKMQGAGNDYIYVECFDNPPPEQPEQLVRAMSDRHYGIGADGLVLIGRSERYDAQMRMFNADGSPSETCGNALRCVAKYLYDRGLVRRTTIEIESAGSLMVAELSLRGETVEQVRVDMGEPILSADQIPTTLLPTTTPSDPVVDVPLALPNLELTVTCVSMGNPHCVVFVDELTDELVLGTGPIIEHDAHFPRRVNAEFVEVLTRGEVRQRTWERGSGETLACGSGASAVCIAGVLTDRTDREITVHLPGGDLHLEWNKTNNHVYLTGPAIEVFTGNWP